MHERADSAKEWRRSESVTTTATLPNANYVLAFTISRKSPLARRRRKGARKLPTDVYRKASMVCRKGRSSAALDARRTFADRLWRFRFRRVAGDDQQRHRELFAVLDVTSSRSGGRERTGHCRAGLRRNCARCSAG